VLKYSIPDQAKITHHSDEEIQFEAIAGQAGVTNDGVLISPETIKASSRWLLGRPVTVGAVGSPAGASRAIGQVDSVEVQEGGELKVAGTLWPQKLSRQQLQSMEGAERPLKAQAGFFLMAMPESGTWEGKSYKEKATGLQYDHLSLVLPELKGHSAPTREDELRELERSWEARLGRKC
jgi:hypothetical protein